MVTDKERLATLEVKADRTEEGIKDHESRIDVLEKALVALVHEVKLIRYALFTLAASTTPGALTAVKQLFSAFGN